MPKWNLMRLATASDGARSLAPLTKEQEPMAPWYEMLLARAAEAECGSPIFSDYHVKGCIAAGELTHAYAENIEYGHYQALHSEEAAVAALVSRLNSMDCLTPPVLAIVAGHGSGDTVESFTMPCGNCRDFLRDTISEHGCTLLLGTLDGGTGVVATLHDAFFDHYARVPLDRIDVMDTWVAKTIREGAKASDNPYFNPDKCPLRNYVVALTTGESQISDRTYFGGTQNDEDFHPDYPIEIALLQAKLARDPYVRSLVVVAEGDGSAPPDVMYRDRQRLLSAVIRRELLTGKRYDLPVRLFTHTNGKLTGAWKTSAEEWLPLPFSPRNFGLEFLGDYTAYLKKGYRR